MKSNGSKFSKLIAGLVAASSIMPIVGVNTSAMEENVVDDRIPKFVDDFKQVYENMWKGSIDRVKEFEEAKEMFSKYNKELFPDVLDALAEIAVGKNLRFVNKDKFLANMKRMVGICEIKLKNTKDLIKQFENANINWSKVDWVKTVDGL